MAKTRLTFDPSIRWFDRQGNPLPTKSAEDFLAIEKLLANTDYKVVRQTTIPPDVLVSTVWMGLDHAFPFLEDPNHIPLIFETMIFSDDSGEIDGKQWRHATEKGALDAHKRIVSQVKEFLAGRRKKEEIGL